jgi:hypothetical protein
MDPTAQILQHLHDSEINFMIVAFWDCGFRVLLGDELNGFVAEDRYQSFADAVHWLAATALQKYPESDFARKYRP